MVYDYEIALQPGVQGRGDLIQSLSAKIRAGINSANAGFTTTISARCTRAGQGHIPLFGLNDRYREFGWLNDCNGATRSNVGTWPKAVAAADYR